MRKYSDMPLNDFQEHYVFSIYIFSVYLNLLGISYAKSERKLIAIYFLN